VDDVGLSGWRPPTIWERFKQAGVPSVFSRAWLCDCLAECGEFSDSFAVGDEGVRIADASERGFREGHGRLGTHDGADREVALSGLAKALPAQRKAGRVGYARPDCDGDIPRDGHDVLAGDARGGGERSGLAPLTRPTIVTTFTR